MRIEAISPPAFHFNGYVDIGFAHAQGPLDTADLSGLDTVAHVADNLREQYGDRFVAPQILRALTNAGHLGRKTGRGFSDYESAT